MTPWIQIFKTSLLVRMVRISDTLLCWTYHYTGACFCSSFVVVSGNAERNDPTAEMRRDEMRWDEMRWDEMRWDEMRWDEMRWDEMRWDDATAFNCVDNYVSAVHPSRGVQHHTPQPASSAVADWHVSQPSRHCYWQRFDKCGYPICFLCALCLRGGSYIQGICTRHETGMLTLLLLDHFANHLLLADISVLFVCYSDSLFIRFCLRLLVISQSCTSIILN